jgi:predicted ATPase
VDDSTRGLRLARYHSLVIRRFYVYNFRCLENFEPPIAGLSSVLLIGKNGSGKTAVGLALEILQRIGRGTNRVGDLVRPKDFSRGRADVPMRFEIEVELEAKTYAYALALQLPTTGGKELRVFEERLSVDGGEVYSREGVGVRRGLVGKVSVADLMTDLGTPQFDPRYVALPILPERLRDDPMAIFKQWLARIIILRPMPGLILGDSKEDTLEPVPQVTNFGEWFFGVLAQAPAAYSKISEHLTQIMHDFQDIRRPSSSGSLVVRFSNEQGIVEVPFEDLSAGEKCFMICALVLAANEAYGPLLCFWDEPDNYLALDEVQHFVLALRKAFQSSGGQFIATSHNPEAIRAFSDENTLLLHRRSHLEPTLVRKLSELHVRGDLVGALIRGDVEPDGRQQS